MQALVSAASGVPRPIRAAAALLLVLLALPTAWLAWIGAGVSIDPANGAMKSVGTPEARHYLRRVALFGEDHLVLIAATDPSLAGQEAVESLADDLMAIDGVEDVIDLPSDRTTWPVLAVLLRGDRSGGGYAEPARRVLARVSEDARASRLLVTGQPIAEIAIAEGVRRESRRMLPWVLAVLLLMVGQRYRRAGPVLAVLTPPLAAIAWIGGLYVLLGYRLDPVSSLLQPVLLTVGVAGSVHLVEAFRRRCRQGAQVWLALREAWHEIAFPALLTVVTTIAGFLALGVHSIPAVRRFGILAAAGVALAAVLTVLAGSAWLIVLPASVGSGRSEGSPYRWTAPAKWLSAHRRGVLLVFALLSVTAATQWTRLQVDTDPVAVLPASSAFRQDFRRLTDQLGGVEVFGLLVPAKDHERVAALRKVLIDQPQVVDVVDEQQAASGETLLTAVIVPASTARRRELFDAVDGAAAAVGSPGSRAVGTVVRVARDSQRLVHDQLLASLLTVLVLLLATLWASRRPLLALVGTIPNLVPGIVVYGALAALGRPVSVATAMIASVMLGLVVDDTLHFLVRFVRARRAELSVAAAIAEAMTTAGAPIVFTSLVLSAGFAVPLAFGTLITTREFGALAVATILLALLADLILLPALLLFAGQWASKVSPVSRAQGRGAGESP